MTGPYQDPRVQRTARSLYRWQTLDLWMQGCLVVLVVVPLLICCGGALWIALN